MPDAEVYEFFGREYRRIYGKCAEVALLQCGSTEGVEVEVGKCVFALGGALNGVDVNIAYLALSHVLEHHFMEPLQGR